MASSLLLSLRPYFGPGAASSYFLGRRAPRRRAASTVAALVAFYAAAGAWALALHNGICFGVALGLPVAIWSNFCRAKRTQRDLQGVLWNEVGFIGAHQNRIRYLSVQS